MAEKAQFVGGLADGAVHEIEELVPYCFFYMQDGRLVNAVEDDSPVIVKKAMYHRLGDTSIYVWVRIEE